MTYRISWQTCDIDQSVYIYILSHSILFLIMHGCTQYCLSDFIYYSMNTIIVVTKMRLVICETNERARRTASLARLPSNTTCAGVDVELCTPNARRYCLVLGRGSKSA